MNGRERIAWILCGVSAAAAFLFGYLWMTSRPAAFAARPDQAPAAVAPARARQGIDSLEDAFRGHWIREGIQHTRSASEISGLSDEEYKKLIRSGNPPADEFLIVDKGWWAKDYRLHEENPTGPYSVNENVKYEIVKADLGTRSLRVHQPGQFRVDFFNPQTKTTEQRSHTEQEFVVTFDATFTRMSVAYVGAVEGDSTLYRFLRP